MTKYSNQERKTEQAEARAHHITALVTALGNPSEWEPTGVVIDCYLGGSSLNGGYCACGHDIRWAYEIRHPKKGINYLGSTCIFHYKTIDLEVYEKLQVVVKKHKAELKRLAQIAAEQEAMAQVAGLKLEFEFKRDTLRNLIHLWEPYSPPKLELELNKIGFTSPRYQKAQFYIKWYTKALDLINLLWNDVNREHYTKLEPTYSVRTSQGEVVSSAHIGTLMDELCWKFRADADKAIKGWKRYAYDLRRMDWSWSATTRFNKFVEAGFITEIINAPDWLKGQ